MHWGIEVTWAIALILLCTLGWLLNLISLPGNWVAVILVVGYVWVGPQEGPTQLG